MSSYLNFSCVCMFSVWRLRSHFVTDMTYAYNQWCWSRPILLPLSQVYEIHVCCCFRFHLLAISGDSKPYNMGVNFFVCEGKKSLNSHFIHLWFNLKSRPTKILEVVPPGENIAPRHSRGAIFCHLFREMRKYCTKAQLWCNILSSLQTWRLQNVNLD